MEKWKKHRLFGIKRDNLKSSRRRSASCPNLQQAADDGNFDGEYCRVKDVDDSFIIIDQDFGKNDKENKSERINSQTSASYKVQKKKEIVPNELISMDDYHSKLEELKMWLHEQEKKDPSLMKSPKLKSHFKTFMKLWNKKKLPAKYYNRDAENVGPKTLQKLAGPSNMSVCPMGEGIVACEPVSSVSSIGSTTDSPFSTFGKAPENPFSSPAFLAQQVDLTQMNFTAKERNAHTHHYDHVHTHHYDHSQSCSTSPQKFATISRSTPVTSLYKFSAQPWLARDATTVQRPVFSPKCPKLSQDLRKSNSFSVSKTHPSSCVSAASDGDTDHMREKWVAGWNKLTEQSPVYETVLDAVPTTSISPIYSEITGEVFQESDYCTLSKYQNWKTSDIKQPVVKKSTFNRRRSKSMEDIYTMPVKYEREKTKPVLFEEKPDIAFPPPVPEKRFSPKKLFTTVLSPKPVTLEKEKFIPAVVEPMFFDIPGVGDEGSGQKRRSQESVGSSQQETTPSKKAKGNVRPNCAGDTVEFQDEGESSATKLSILTGSLRPTTRNKVKHDDSLELQAEANSFSKRKDDAELGVLQVQKLEESPKFPRRRIKRRSSSLSTTPGKGLTFGKLNMSSPKRRVSFAKDVKETEGNSAVRRRSSSRSVVPSPVIITKQTLDRKEFETFLSTHTSPPKKSPSKSPVKTQSPDKISPKKLSFSAPVINLKKRTDEKLNENKFPSPPPAEERLFPLSPTRQVGRRVSGKPSASPQSSVKVSVDQTLTRNTRTEGKANSPLKTFNNDYKLSSPVKTNPTKTLSPQKLFKSPSIKSSPPKKLFEPQLSLGLPKKLIFKLGEKTAAICASEMSESEGYSSGDDLLNPQTDHVLTKMDTHPSACSDPDLNFTQDMYGESNDVNINNQSLSLLTEQIEEFTRDMNTEFEDMLQKLPPPSPELTYQYMSTSHNISKQANCINKTNSLHDKIPDSVNLQQAPVYNLTPSNIVSGHYENKPALFQKDVTSTQLSTAIDEFELEAKLWNERVASPGKSSLLKTFNFVANCKSPSTSHSHKAAAGEMFSEKHRAETHAGPGSSPENVAVKKSGLERLESIRASPKIVDNDGWITERRRSSRGKLKQSFRSAYNKYLLSSSVLDDTLSCEDSIHDSVDDTSSCLKNYVHESVDISSHKDVHSSKDTLSSKDIIHGSLDETHPEAKPQQEIKPTPVSEYTQVYRVASTVVTSVQLPQARQEFCSIKQKLLPLPSPVKAKPAILPKPAKVLSLAQRKLNVNNSGTTTSAKRRSSVEKNMKSRRESNANFIQRNINAVRRDSSVLKNSPRQSILTAQKTDKQLSRAGNVVNGDNSSLGNKRRSRTVTSDADSAVRRRSKTNPAVENTATARRRSRTSQENRVPSFSERRKFFQQLQVQAEPKPALKPGSLTQHRNKIANVVPVTSPAKASSQSGFSLAKGETQL
ncbi:uncharacterized protein LOC131945228 [Physella acuta]|uniref:uncharacterized protein LOC131945228 n=1 Tax=Physella acuta TaxID=109671 RepID=UPI0027DBFE76|nr:uncharacterized protein LOC131945228 [Physella acuta]